MKDLGRCSRACLVWRRDTLSMSLTRGKGRREGTWTFRSFLSGIRRVTVSQAQQSTTSTHLPSIWSLVTGIRKRGIPATQVLKRRVLGPRTVAPFERKSSWIYSGTTGNRSQQSTGSSRSGDTDVVGKVQDDSEVGHQIGDPMLST